MKIMLDEGAKMPTRAHTRDGGLDIYAAERKIIRANDFVVVETGTHIQIPPGCVGLLTSKSGLMCKGITCRGTIDSGYTGSIKAVLFNNSGRDYIVEKGDKVTQLVILKCEFPELELVDSLEETDRGDAGFGSTGR